ncbi:hypothetical protein BV898_18050 [Hypsibius exemplaris]|uniref:Myb-like domain-containing protein n=1 Tax=Hypsibius exemplaris TaxID=2072580 RepID=A0A9X6RMQ8_HYPEX|nr:hypothetical protein BV898_18050 [Hypsibius exemplaris]
MADYSFEEPNYDHQDQPPNQAAEYDAYAAGGGDGAEGNVAAEYDGDYDLTDHRLHHGYGPYDDDDGAQDEEKSMAVFANQRFKRAKKSGTATTPRIQNKQNSFTSNQDDEEETAELDEAEQAEADEFFSQMIQPTGAGENDSNEDGSGVVDEDDRRASSKKRPRWHAQECEFFRRCAALYDCNYTMIRDYLPHRSVADIKKQYDKQRAVFPSLFASFGTSPRFHSVAEYEQLVEQLKEAKEKLDAAMRELGIRPWAQPKKKGKRGEEDEEEEDAEEEDAEEEDAEEEDAEEDGDLDDGDDEVDKTLEEDKDEDDEDPTGEEDGEEDEEEEEEPVAEDEEEPEAE